jgi:hypothetical protein
MKDYKPGDEQLNITYGRYSPVRIIVPIDAVLAALADYTVGAGGEYVKDVIERPNLFEGGTRWGVRLTIEAIPQTEEQGG